MKILLTGATGYIGKRLLPALINEGHEIVCCVRDKNRFQVPKSFLPYISVIEIDFADRLSFNNLPKDIDAAYFLMHSMSNNSDYESLEIEVAKNFNKLLKNISVKQVIYLSGIVNEKQLSKHLSSRKNVELELEKGNYNLTVLRAGIIIGSGSASFEIIRDLAEKLPVMITPKWLKTLCQPIAIGDVITILQKVLTKESTYNQNFDIGGSDILSYKEMLENYALLRGFKRLILVVPVMTPRLSSYWLYFVTSTSYKLAVALVDSMKIEVVCRDNRINQILNITPISYKESIQNAFQRIDKNEIISSWKDAMSSSNKRLNISDFVRVPENGCFSDIQYSKVKNSTIVINSIWNIGGNNGWYYANWLWRFRGIIDKFCGGVGLRRGRTSQTKLKPGDALDFWRVLYANKEEGRLLLFAEMKLPGEAWLEFKLIENTIMQKATFRPKGILGRLYWYAMSPFHYFVFKGMLKTISDQKK